MTSSPVDPALARWLAVAPDTAVAVMVEFRRPPDPGDVAALGLAAMGATLAGGSLTPAEVSTLAEREDVLRIEAVPEAHPT